MRPLVLKGLNRFGLDAVPVENATACPGTPDVNCTLGWIELKQLEEWPKLPYTPVRIRHFKQEQRVWLFRRWKADRSAWLLLKVGRREWLLFDGITAFDSVGHVPRHHLIEIAHAYWRAGMDWESLKECLESTRK